MLHSEHLVCLESVDVFDCLIELNIHASSAFTNIATSSSLLNEVKKHAISSAYFFDCSIKLLPTITIQTSHELGSDTTTVKSCI